MIKLDIELIKALLEKALSDWKERLDWDGDPYADAAVTETVDAAINALPTLLAIAREKEGLKASEDAFPFKMALSELVSLRAEADAVGEWPAVGQAPSWEDRWASAWTEAEELVRVEP